MTGQWQVTGNPAQNRVFLHIRLFSGRPQHFSAGGQKEQTEEVKDPMELLD